MGQSAPIKAAVRDADAIRLRPGARGTWIVEAPSGSHEPALRVAFRGPHAYEAAFAFLRSVPSETLPAGASEPLKRSRAAAARFWRGWPTTEACGPLQDSLTT